MTCHSVYFNGPRRIKTIHTSDSKLYKTLTQKDFRSQKPCGICATLPHFTVFFFFFFPETQSLLWRISGLMAILMQKWKLNLLRVCTKTDTVLTRLFGQWHHIHNSVLVQSDALIKESYIAVLFKVTERANLSFVLLRDFSRKLWAVMLVFDTEALVNMLSLFKYTSK